MIANEIKPLLKEQDIVKRSLENIELSKIHFKDGTNIFVASYYVRHSLERNQSNDTELLQLVHLYLDDRLSISDLIKFEVDLTETFSSTHISLIREADIFMRNLAGIPEELKSKIDIKWMQQKNKLNKIFWLLQQSISLMGVIFPEDGSYVKPNDLQVSEYLECVSVFNFDGIHSELYYLEQVYPNNYIIPIEGKTGMFYLLPYSKLAHLDMEDLKVRFKNRYIISNIGDKGMSFLPISSYLHDLHTKSTTYELDKFKKYLPILNKLLNNCNLDRSEAEEIFAEIMDGNLPWRILFPIPFDSTSEIKWNSLNLALKSTSKVLDQSRADHVKIGSEMLMKSMTLLYTELASEVSSLYPYLHSSVNFIDYNEQILLFDPENILGKFDTEHARIQKLREILNFGLNLREDKSFHVNYNLSNGESVMVYLVRVISDNRSQNGNIEQSGYFVWVNEPK